MEPAQDGPLNPLLPGPVEILVLMVLPLILLVVAALIVVTLVRLTSQRHADRARETRLVAAVRWAGIGVGTALAFVQLTVGILPSPGLGVDVIHAPILFGLAVLGAAVLGELVVRPRFASGPRTADLRPRLMRDFLPVALTRVVGGISLGAAALCAFTWLTASTDDMGRPGRTLSAVCSPLYSFSSGPYPGSFYVLPYALGVSVALVIAVFAARQVTHRSLGGTPAQADHHRRTSMQAIVGAFGVVVAVPMVGIALFAGSALAWHSCPQTGWVQIGWLSFALAVAALGTLAYSLIALLAPAASRPTVREREAVRG